MKKIVLAGACRTAIGTMGGSLSTVPAAELGSVVIKEALARAGVPAEQVDHVYMGCVIQAGLGQNVARQASLKAGLPVTTPAVTVNVVCGSGLNCVNMAAQMIEAGDADIVVAGGMESMSLAPYAMMKGRYGYRMGNATLVDTMVNDALWDAFNNYHMGITAENVAEQWHLTREDLDAFAANSQQKCEKAMAEGKFKEEIVPVEVKGKKGSEGYNVRTGEYGDLIKCGVVDPAKVARTALQNAASIAGLLLTTDCMVTDIPEKKDCGCGGHGAGQPGMDGMM